MLVLIPHWVMYFVLPCGRKSWVNIKKDILKTARGSDSLVVGKP